MRVQIERTVMRLLLTAFDPFGGDAINPALEADAQNENLRRTK